MSMTAVGGSYAAMVGIETYMKTKGRLKELKQGMKAMTIHENYLSLTQNLLQNACGFGQSVGCSSQAVQVRTDCGINGSASDNDQGQVTEPAGHEIAYDAARYTAKYESDGFVEQMRMIYPTRPCTR